MVRRSGSRLGEAIRLTFLGLGIAIMVVVLSGPLRSGAIFLLLPTFPQRVEHDLPPSYRPLHKGHVDLATGQYIREDEDLVVRGTPPLILRRIYLSRDHELRRFGIGTTHNGETLVFARSPLLQQVNVLLGDIQVEFDRTTTGTTVANAM